MAKAEKKTVEINSFKVLSVGKVFALLGAVAGFVLGLLMSVMMYQISNNPMFQQLEGFEQVTSTQLIAVPFWYLVLFGILWGLISMLFALVYNFIAKKSGGIKLAIK